MKRPLFALLSALSLLLFLATAVYWLRSYWSQERITWITQNGYYSLWTAHGSLELGFLHGNAVYKPTETAGPKYTRDRADQPFNGLVFYGFDFPLTQSDWQHAGFAWHQVHQPSRLYVNAFAPFWSLALLTSLLPLAWLAARRRSHRRQNLGLCSTCGYDLRATPTRCPECGTLTKSSA